MAMSRESQFQVARTEKSEWTESMRENDVGIGFKPN